MIVSLTLYIVVHFRIWLTVEQFFWYRFEFSPIAWALMIAIPIATIYMFYKEYKLHEEKIKNFIFTYVLGRR